MCCGVLSVGRKESWLVDMRSLYQGSWHGLRGWNSLAFTFLTGPSGQCHLCCIRYRGKGSSYQHCKGFGWWSDSWITVASRGLLHAVCVQHSWGSCCGFAWLCFPTHRAISSRAVTANSCTLWLCWGMSSLLQKRIHLSPTYDFQQIHIFQRISQVEFPSTVIVWWLLKRKKKLHTVLNVHPAL